jgi:hypothetical protein
LRAGGGSSSRLAQLSQQRRIGDVDLFSLQPVSFGGDMLQQRARNINRTLLEQESKG